MIERKLNFLTEKQRLDSRPGLVSFVDVAFPYVLPYACKQDGRGRISSLQPELHECLSSHQCLSGCGSPHQCSLCTNIQRVTVEPK